MGGKSDHNSAYSGRRGLHCFEHSCVRLGLVYSLLKIYHHFLLWLIGKLTKKVKVNFTDRVDTSPRSCDRKNRTKTYYYHNNCTNTLNSTDSLFHIFQDLMFPGVVPWCFLPADETFPVISVVS